MVTVVSMAQVGSLAPRVFMSYICVRKAMKTQRKSLMRVVYIPKKEPAAAEGRRRPFLAI